MGYDQHAFKLYLAAFSLPFSHRLSVEISETITLCFKKAAVPHDPLLSPIGIPSALCQNALGKLGAVRLYNLPSFISCTEQCMPGCRFSMPAKYIFTSFFITFSFLA